MRRLHDLELEPEVRAWLDSLSDSDYKGSTSCAGMLAVKGTQLGGPWSDHLDGEVWELRIRLRDVAGRHPTHLTWARWLPESEAARLA